MMKPLRALLCASVTLSCLAVSLSMTLKGQENNICSVLEQSDAMASFCQLSLGMYQVIDKDASKSPLFFVWCIGKSVPEGDIKYKKYDSDVSDQSISKWAMLMKDTQDAIQYAKCIQCTATLSTENNVQDERVSEHYTWSMHEVQKCHDNKTC